MSAEQDLADANVKIANLIAEVTRFRDAAMGFNAIYPTITEGRQAVDDGKYFSVPGSGAYMRLYRRQGTSSELIAEFPDRAELNSVIDQLGPLLGRGVVGGSGDLMAFGALGIGQLLPETNTKDFDLLPVGRSLTDQTDLVNAPSSTGRHLVITDSTLALFSQIALRRDTSGLSSRSGSSLEQVGAWRNYFNNHNIMGAVSEADGVQTGGVFEYGSNANGEYLIFAGGLIIAIRNGSNVAVDSIAGPGGSIYRSDQIQNPLPIPITNPVFMGASASPVAWSACSISGDNWRYRLYSDAPRSSETSVLFAIGFS